MEDSLIPSKVDHCPSYCSTNLEPANSPWLLANVFELHNHRTLAVYSDQNEDEQRSWLLKVIRKGSPRVLLSSPWFLTVRIPAFLKFFRAHMWCVKYFESVVNRIWILSTIQNSCIWFQHLSCSANIFFSGKTRNIISILKIIIH